MEEAEVLKCGVCGEIVEDGKKFFRKSQKCKKCYDKRWQRERKEKLKESADRVKKVASLPHGDTGVVKAKAVKPKPANVSAAAGELDKTEPTNGTAAAITRIEGEIEYLENQKEGIEYKLSVLRDVRGMLG